MSDLIAIAYPDHAAVERARDNLHRAMADGVIQVEDVVVMRRDQDGTLEVRQGSSGVVPATVGGAMTGGLIGLVFLAPLFGMAVGAVGGRAMWKSMFGDVGVAQNLVDELGTSLTPGSGALLVLVREMKADQVLPRIEEPGQVIQTSLSREVEEQLDAALSAGGAKDAGSRA